MEYTGFKLVFSTSVHFGNGSLENSDNRIYADTIFSVLCHEAVKLECIEELVSYVKNEKIKLSDAFPFIGDSYYIPKPMITIESERNIDDKKKAKKLEFINVDLIDEYLDGSMDIKRESEILSNLGKSDIITRAVIQSNEDTKPYSVGTYLFSEGAGLYLIVGYRDEDALNMITKLLHSLSYVGIGGKVSSGLGKFNSEQVKLPISLTDKIKRAEESSSVMSLSVGMCDDMDLENVCENSNYILSKRSGFINSSTYSDNIVKKQDFYLFRAGSVFSRPFKGLIKDVAIKGKHPVYRYANPIFMEVSNDE
ncbi:type III-A CRISPR-associated RAMP protein Csm4 [Mogibacterium diversum]|uniref:type III-A CRISPR-associated RAMP protein Csm4 n=1 Tax=Mogibacterium diversum TaxID=114527 RepID=UPI0028D6F623|nr:type III-A CRISPR-associated RAMP protein Csm4 [Mogibacterium diversum]